MKRWKWDWLAMESKSRWKDENEFDWQQRVSLGEKNEKTQKKKPKKEKTKKNRKRKNPKNQKKENSKKSKIQKIQKNQKRKNPKKIEKENPKNPRIKKKKNLFSVILDKICVFCLYPIPDSQQYVKRGSCRRPILSGLLVSF